MQIIFPVGIALVLMIIATKSGWLTGIPAEWIGLIGVVIGSVITITKDIWLVKLERKQNASYAAAQLINILENYRWDCLKVLKDKRDNYDPPGPYDNTVPEPPLKFPDDIILNSIESPLLYKLLALQNDTRNINEYIRYLESIADVDAWFDYRKVNYLEFAKKASCLAKNLHDKYKHPENYSGSENSSHTKFMTHLDEWEREDNKESERKQELFDTDEEESDQT